MCHFQSIFYLVHALGELRFDFYLGHSFFHVISNLKGAEFKMRENKGPTLLQGAGLHRQIKPRPDLNKNAENKGPNYYYNALNNYIILETKNNFFSY